MGRSVSYPSNAAVVAYGTFEPEDDDDFAFDYVIDDFRDEVARMFPSANPCDKWVGREDHALMENRYAYFGISEYCGLVAYWVAPKDQFDERINHYLDPESWTGLRDRWISQIEDKFRNRFCTLRKIGTASNGESFFERVNQ